jgi:hypothetical protein
MGNLTHSQLVSIDLVQQQVIAAADWLQAEARREMWGIFNWRMHGDEAYDSPIEAVFEGWWRVMEMACHISRDCKLVPQKQVVVGGRKYRLDFAIEPEDMQRLNWERDGLKAPLVCVELDGHEWHERTKEQVSYRNQRDRDLQAAGWLVLHYSGSELIRKPTVCVTDANTKASDAFWKVKEILIDRMYGSAERAAANQAGVQLVGEADAKD